VVENTIEKRDIFGLLNEVRAESARLAANLLGML